MYKRLDGKPLKAKQVENLMKEYEEARKRELEFDPRQHRLKSEVADDYSVQILLNNKFPVLVDHLTMEYSLRASNFPQPQSLDTDRSCARQAPSFGAGILGQG